jgi:hypothetical protein
VPVSSATFLRPPWARESASCCTRRRSNPGTSYACFIGCRAGIKERLAIILPSINHVYRSLTLFGRFSSQPSNFSGQIVISWPHVRLSTHSQVFVFKNAPFSFVPRARKVAMATLTRPKSPRPTTPKKDDKEESFWEKIGTLGRKKSKGKDRELKLLRIFLCRTSPPLVLTSEHVLYSLN